jgi:hypothetical protein
VILFIPSVGVSMLFVSGCTSKLSATFESDVIGNLPDKKLPGSPAGDAISYVPEIETQLKVIATLSHPSKKSP